MDLSEATEQITGSAMEFLELFECQYNWTDYLWTILQSLIANTFLPVNGKINLLNEIKLKENIILQRNILNWMGYFAFPGILIHSNWRIIYSKDCGLLSCFMLNIKCKTKGFHYAEELNLIKRNSLLKTIIILSWFQKDNDMIPFVSLNAVCTNVFHIFHLNI